MDRLQRHHRGAQRRGARGLGKRAREVVGVLVRVPDVSALGQEQMRADAGLTRRQSIDLRTQQLAEALELSRRLEMVAEREQPLRPLGSSRRSEA